MQCAHHGVEEGKEMQNHEQKRRNEKTEKTLE